MPKETQCFVAYRVCQHQEIHSELVGMLGMLMQTELQTQPTPSGVAKAGSLAVGLQHPLNKWVGDLVGELVCWLAGWLFGGWSVGRWLVGGS